MQRQDLEYKKYSRRQTEQEDTLKEENNVLNAIS